MLRPYKIGYSAPAPPGFIAVDGLWRRLMCEELGYSRFVAHGTDVGARVETSTSIAMFPGESGLLVPRSVAERGYNIVRWRDMERGGHFPSLEAPEDLARDLRESFLA